MRVDFDPEVQGWYLTMSDAPVVTTVHLSGEVAVDAYKHGAVVGVEFLTAPSAVEQPVREAARWLGSPNRSCRASF